MELKDRLITYGFDTVDIFLIDDEKNQETVSNVKLHKVTNLEYKLYLDPESIEYHLDHEDPYFKAVQQEPDQKPIGVKGYILEW
ncbi:hypothetical protein AAV35_013610 [Salimicrobium jeotgali]|uniref:Uncharacterized protein n=2 Tax=Salimicrobium TaxID=351195 RepID=K2FK72_9BACI|nr:MULTISPECIES: hypothetical protein [Salimicrobium]AKG03297.1 hypothetical protein AAV35_013610 [Salimicrobium jeotgali]EKE31456.1 hypothetical protein MJ3_08015 [Salimicrobium jeotgali]MBM7696753.1 hypothetical protein [Salimicrobium jeotgali]PBB05811.1 hypothetical protein CKW00_07380 [Salimicrobium humidisoli]